MHISTKCSVAIHCLIFIQEYGEKAKVTSKLLSRSSGINAVTIRNILSALKRDGIISVRYGTGGARMNCPLGEISLYRLCRALEPDFLSKLIGLHPAPSDSCPVGRNIYPVLDRSYGRIRNDLKASLESITLEQVMADYQECLRTAASGAASGRQDTAGNAQEQ